MNILDIIEKTERNILLKTAKKYNIYEEELLFWLTMTCNSLLLYDYAIRYRSLYFSYLDEGKIKKEINEKTGTNFYENILFSECMSFFKKNIINSGEIIKIKNNIRVFLNKPAKLSDITKFYGTVNIGGKMDDIYNYDLIIKNYLKNSFD